MLLSVFVIEERFLRGALLQEFLRDGNGPVFGLIPVEHGHFERGEGCPGVAVGEFSYGVDKLRADDDLRGAETSPVRQGSSEERLDVLRAERPEHEDPAAREKGAVDFKRGIFRCGADEYDAAPFHEGQEGVLLGLVEAVYFVHEDDGSGAVSSVVLRLLHDGADVFDGARDRGERDERGLRVRGDDVRQRCFAHARRPPENHGGQMVAFDEAAQYLPRPHKMPLPGVLVECAGPEACRQGL